MNQNRGLNLAKELQDQSPEDWEYFGGSLPDLAYIPELEREFYLPKGELQNIGEEKMDCASRAPLNVLEAKLNWLLKNKKLSLENEIWLKANKYVGESGVELSDAFVAINSGTTPQGNSLKAPLEAIRKQGVIPKSVLPQANTWEEHHDPQRITGVMTELGLEFTRRLFINYQKVYEKDFDELLAEDFLIVGGYAWPQPIEGEYPPVSDAPNHAFIAHRRPRYYVFDNYLDYVDQDFIKKLSPKYDLLDYGYRLTINKQVTTPKKRSWLAGIIKYWFQDILK